MPDAPAAAPAAAAPAAGATDPVATPAPAAPPAAAAPAAGAPAAAPAAQPVAEAEGTVLGGKPAAGEPAKEGAAPEIKPVGAPEKYADFKLPEGLVLDKQMLEKALPLFKNAGLSQDVAQKFVDFQAQATKEEVAARETAWKSQVKAWGQEVEKTYTPEQRATAFKAVEQFGGQEAQKLLNETGLGNHPIFFKMFFEAGKGLMEDQPVEGRKAGGEQVPTAALMYPSMAKKAA